MPGIKMAIIDGTGEADKAKYEASMTNSFCRQLGDKLGPLANYERGPASLGTDVLGEATRASRFLFGTWRQDEAARLNRAGHGRMMTAAMMAAETLFDANTKDQDTRLMLAGYSRGGSAAIMAAQMLDKLGVPVDSLFLFDAVARHMFPGGEIIPANVRFSRHARRCQDVELVLRYEGTISEFGDTSNPMRPSFGNTGLQWKGDGDHEIATEFVGSHGALGGVGWPFVDEDKGCQEKVAVWMNGHLHARGVPASLVAVKPDPGPAARTPGRKTKLAGSALDLLLLGNHYGNLDKAGRVKDD